MVFFSILSMSDEKFEYLGQTGFQSACTEYAQETLSLDELFKRSAPNIYFWVATGEPALRWNLSEGDILIIDSTLNIPRVGFLYVVIIGDSHYLGEFKIINNNPFLEVPAKKANRDRHKAQIQQTQLIALKNDFDFEAKVWGGVVAVINIYTRLEVNL